MAISPPILGKDDISSGYQKIALTEVEGRGTFWLGSATFSDGVIYRFLAHPHRHRVANGERRGDSKQACNRYLIKRRGDTRKAGEGSPIEPPIAEEDTGLEEQEMQMLRKR